LTSNGESLLRNLYVYVPEGHEDDKNQVQVLHDNEQIEIAMISNPDTVVDPLAVMIVALHTFVASIAMARVSCADDLTVWT